VGEVGVAEVSVQVFCGDTSKLSVEAPIKTIFFPVFS
jgi:hypothetical protein